MCVAGLVGLTVGWGVGAIESARADRPVRLSPKMVARLRAQMRDITPAAPGTRPVGKFERITPEIAWDAERFNPERMVRLRSFHARTLMGLADPAAVQALLGSRAEPLVIDVGPLRGTPIGVTVNESAGWVGCSCPPLFREFSVVTLIKNPHIDEDGTMGPATAHFVPLYMSTNHLKRQESLVRKFSMPSYFVGLPALSSDEPHLGFRSSDQGVVGFYVKDQSGRTVFEAKRNSGVMDEPRVATPFLLDNVFYALNETTYHAEGSRVFDFFRLEGFVQKPVSFRIQGREDFQSFSPLTPPPATQYFNPATDSVQMHPTHPAAQLLSRIQYRPLYWHSEQTNNAIAWIQARPAE